MPKVRTLQRKPPPEGWDTIHPVLQELEAKMRDAEQAPHQGLRKNESLWPIYRIHHQRSRYIYEMYYKRKAITRELYDYCLREKWADPQLIAKWKRNGFEQLCCMRCIQTDATNFGSVCVCRVPRKDQLGDKLVECANCGCRGCASGDV